MYKSVFCNKNILITGHTGFKGFWLAIILKKLGAKVSGISLPKVNDNESHFNILEGEKLFKNYYHDIRDYKFLEPIFREIKPDYIFHLAAQAIVSESYERPLDTFTTNTIGSLNILEAARKTTDKCNIIMITSDKVYENVEWIYGYRENDILGGQDPYSASKASAEIAIKSYFISFLNNTNIRIVTARAGNVVGGGDWSKNRLVPDCIRSWMKNEEVILRSPNSTRPWQHVFEPINGYLKLAEKLNSDKSISGESFNFGPISSSELKVIDAVSIFAEKWQDKCKFSISEENSFKEAKLLKLNCEKSNAILNWYPLIDFNECAELTIDWYKNARANHNKARKITEEQIEWFLKKTKRK